MITYKKLLESFSDLTPEHHHEFRPDVNEKQRVNSASAYRDLVFKKDIAKGRN